MSRSNVAILISLTVSFKLCIDDNSCENGYCIPGILDISSLVGDVASEIRRYCVCDEPYFGQFCNETDTSKFENECNGGILNTTNTLTLCDCKNDDGTVLDSYGWYCDRPNSEQCKNKIGTPGKPKYYHKPSETVEVGKPNCTNPCPPNCNGCYGFINGEWL